MTYDQTAANVVAKVNELAVSIAKRCSPTNQMAQGAIEHHAREVLIEWLAPKTREPSEAQTSYPLNDG